MYKRRWHAMVWLCAAALMGWAAAGCSSTGESAVQAEAPAAPVMAPGDGLQHAGLAYPSGDKSKYIIGMEKAAPREVQVGQQFQYTITLTNNGPYCAKDVAVSDDLPAGYKFSNSTPPPASTDNGRIRWNLGDMEVKEVKTITVYGAVTAPGTIKQCASVSYMPAVCMAVNAVQPQLRLSKAAPSEAMVGQAVPVKFVVSNTGTGVAKNVKVRDTLPEGWTTMDGQTQMEFDAGTLAAGQSRDFTATIKAGRTGQFENKAVAIADGGLTAEAMAPMVVRQPKLAISKTGPEQAYMDRPFSYNIAVSNSGDAIAKDAMLTDALPAGARFISASEGGVFADGRVRWTLGDLRPQDSRKVQLTISGSSVATMSNTAMAQAKDCEPVSSIVQTRIVGVPAMLLEMIDLVDPVAVGSNTTYVITLTNQGSIAQANVKIVCTLEDAMQYVSSEGQTTGKLEGNTLTFEPLPNLAGGSKAMYKVIVRAAKAGDIRMKVAVTSDQLQRPVEKIESTTFYE